MLIPENVREELKKQFGERMKRTITLEVFKEDGMNDEFNQLSVNFATELSELSDRIKFSVHELGSKKAKEREVARSPTILVDPDHYHLRYTGAPAGEEGSSFLEAIIRASSDDPGMDDALLEKVRSIKDDKNLMVFVTPTCPYCPGMVVEAFKMAIANPEHIQAECVEATENIDLATKYQVQGVPNTICNGGSVATGLVPEETLVTNVMDSDAELVVERGPMDRKILEQIEQSRAKQQEAPPIEEGNCTCLEDFTKERDPGIDEDNRDYDIIVIGGGPAGLTAAIYSARSGMRTLVLEGKLAGGLATVNPWVENYPAFQNIPGHTLADLIKDHAATYAPIHEGEQVKAIEKGEKFDVRTASGKYTARAIIFSTGSENRHLGIPGEKEFFGKGVSYCATCDGYLFSNKKVMMVGGGNSAVVEAIYIANLGCNVTLVHRRDELRAEKELQKALEKSDVDIIWDSEPQEIIGSEIVEKVKLLNKRTGKISTVETDAVFISIGEIPNTDLAEKLGVKLNKEGFIKVDIACRTSVKGVYAAGDVIGGVNQIVTAAGEGAKAANSAYSDLLLSGS